MTSPDDFAFPVANETLMINGLTKREYFAAQVFLKLVNVKYEPTVPLVKQAVEAADALIAELNKEPK